MPFSSYIPNFMKKFIRARGQIDEDATPCTNLSRQPTSFIRDKMAAADARVCQVGNSYAVTKNVGDSQTAIKYYGLQMKQITAAVLQCCCAHEVNFIY